MATDPSRDAAPPRGGERAPRPSAPHSGPRVTSRRARSHGGQVECDGEWIATVIESERGRYLAPPVVFDPRGTVVMGFEVLAAVATSGVEIDHPVLHDYGPADLAALEQQLIRVAAQLAIPLRSP